MGAGAALMASRSSSAAALPVLFFPTQRISLGGSWEFRTDPEDRGELGGWFAGGPATGWHAVEVPHTWQVEAQTTGYFGAGWYRRQVTVPEELAGWHLRLRFEAAYHTATVWLNGRRLGSHERKGYTAFELDASQAARPGEPNTLVVKVDNRFRDDMLPRGRSYDWAPDGGLIRPVWLLATPRTFLDRVEVEAYPERDRRALVRARAVVRHMGTGPARVRLRAVVRQEHSGLEVARLGPTAPRELQAGTSAVIELPETILQHARLWHFDDPFLYRLEVWLEPEAGPGHREWTTFGIRKIEVKDTGFYLNGERVWLAGVERMAGSNPLYGMAEPASWIEREHADMKRLNCIFTRVHWPPDERVLDFCDRHGILIQLEVPAWGPRTFAGMKGKPDPVLLENGLEQLRELISQYRNHPSVFSWGVANKINGQNPPAQEFARRLYAEARRLDPSRPVTYASHSLRSNPEQDVAGEMDFIMWNEYYESWTPGDLAAMEENLQRIHAAFPQKAIVISEYGYCECRPEHSGGDPKRIDILRRHTAVFRKYPYVAGVIFFDYNDYRTHMGDQGVGALQQRVHGVVDLFGQRKPSYEALRAELSPVAGAELHYDGGLVLRFQVRERLPGHPLRGYRLRWVVYGFGDLPMEMGERALPLLEPGAFHLERLAWTEPAPRRVRLEILRPTGFPVWEQEWRPA